MQHPAALVTGATGGIGSALAHELASAGYRVFLSGRRADVLQTLCSEIRESGGEAACLAADLCDADAAEHLVTETVRHYGRIDLLVACAGVALRRLIQDTGDDDWDMLVAADLSSVFRCCRAAVPQMVRQQSGSIVTVSSVWGARGASMESAYSAVKAGIIGLTKALAKECAPSGIRVNCAAPGVIDTAMNAEYNSDERQALCEEIPLGRFGTPEETARSIRFLAEAPYVTGQVLGIDGGFGL